LSLLNLHARRIRRIKLLIDYNRSHVVIVIEYLEIMQQKAIEKEVVKHLKEVKRKEKEE
jgi:hypothetical protein